MLKRQSVFKHFVIIILMINNNYTNSNYFYLVISNWPVPSGDKLLVNLKK